MDKTDAELMQTEHSIWAVWLRFCQWLWSYCFWCWHIDCV